MSTEVSVIVWRPPLLPVGLSNDSPQAHELHRNRSNALHEVLDNVDGVRVVKWGQTHDSKPHESVELVIDFAQWITQPEQVQAISVAAISIGKLLGNVALGEAVKEGTKWLFERLRKKQKDGQISDVTINLSSMVVIHLAPPKGGGRVSVTVQVEGEPGDE